MDNTICVGGDGGPLIILQAAAVPLWQGAVDFDNSLMGGGDIETDYDVICESATEFGIISRHGRDMAVLWDSEFSAMLLPPHLLSLSADMLVLLPCYHGDSLPSILPHIRNAIAEGRHEYAVPFDIQDTSLRLQVGADGGEGIIYNYKYCDIPVIPGVKRCTVYLVEHNAIKDSVVVITAEEQRGE